VLRWPTAAEVLSEAERWAVLQRSDNTDLLLILEVCSEPVWERLRRWETRALPLACDLLVYSLQEWASLPQWNPRLGQVLRQETRWLGEVTERLRTVL
jgi:hypothetical protein